MTHYDFILAGGGLAGLSLAYHLINSPLRDRSILIIDKDAKQQNDRTWCFWEEQPTLFDEIAYRVWHRLRFVGDDFTREFDLAPYRYQMIRGIDFYDFTREKLSKCANVTFMRGNIDRVDDGADRATVIIDGQAFSGSWVFDSTLPPSLRGSVPTSLRGGQWPTKQSPTTPDEIASQRPVHEAGARQAKALAMTTNGHYYHLYQHFRGWEIETNRPVFNPQLPTLFDFRTPQNGHMRFVYTLPFTENRALIEYTLFSSYLLTSEEYDAGLKTYIEEVLGITQYAINHVEAGVIPMTDRPFPRRLGQRVMAIGTKGGRVKPSTGYAFLRIQRDSAAIVASLVKHDQPFDISARRGRFGLHDSILLNIMTHHPGELKSIFTLMFQNNPIQRIFRFLDETATLSEEVRFIASLPPRRFLQALFHLKVLRRA
ncbi:MAG TPA: lycopene cyclase family protein [Anaerolineae bacterium]|nr:lycopene cyclase family protein [Anaerolineae bacterium]